MILKVFFFKFRNFLTNSVMVVCLEYIERVFFLILLKTFVDILCYEKFIVH